MAEAEIPAARKSAAHEKRRESKSGLKRMPKHGKSVFLLQRLQADRAEKTRQAGSLKGAKK